jgi:hypothetical protein
MAGPTGFEYLKDIKFAPGNEQIGSFAEHRVEEMASRYGFNPKFNPLQAAAFLQDIGQTDNDDYRWLVAQSRTGPGEPMGSGPISESLPDPVGNLTVGASSERGTSLIGPDRSPEAAGMLSAVVAAVYFQVKGRSDEAQEALRPIASLPWGGIPPWPRPTTAPPPGVSTWKGFSRTRSADTFRRDHFQCQYCGQLVIPLPLLALMSFLYPKLLPYNIRFKAGATHPVYWLLAPEADHIKPGSRGGEWEDPSNIATACVVCNTKKGNWTLEELGWVLEPKRDGSWDGLVPFYGPIWEAAGRPEKRYHDPWLRALEGQF